MTTEGAAVAALTELQARQRQAHLCADAAALTARERNAGGGDDDLRVGGDVAADARPMGAGHGGLDQQECRLAAGRDP
jgi:hypothetical protein